MSVTNQVWFDLFALALQRDAMEQAYQALRERLQGRITKAA